jgi:hypothetical protein
MVAYNSLMTHDDERPEAEREREVTAIDGRIPADRLGSIAERIAKRVQPQAAEPVPDEQPEAGDETG